MQLRLGDEYTREAIHQLLGGSRRACLPTRDGVVVAACLLKSLNPDAPRVMLCGVGPRNGPAGAALAAQAGPVPIFTKVTVNRWRYEGSFAVVAALASGARYDDEVAASGRAPASVSRVLLFEPRDP